MLFRSEIKKLSEESQSAVGDIQTITEEIISSVAALSENSNKMLEFIDKQVLNDYDNMKNTARQYKLDAESYLEIATNLGAACEEMSSSLSTVLGQMENVSSINQEISAEMKSIDSAAADSAKNTDEISNQVRTLEELSSSLNEILKHFTV